MAKYICSLCGFIYDEAPGGAAEQVTSDTRWERLPDDWTCPLCGALKSDFEKQGEPVAAVEQRPMSAEPLALDTASLTSLEISALCTNLARGCEKQYQAEAKTLFDELADYFKGISEPAADPDYDQLSALVENDLEVNFPAADAAATAVNDRGALRALVWSQKVTRIIKSVLTRYRQQGESLVENSELHLCTVCGFIYLGDRLPDVCPVCKVPNWKFEMIAGR